MARRAENHTQNGIHHPRRTRRRRSHGRPYKRPLRLERHGPSIQANGRPRITTEVSLSSSFVPQTLDRVEFGGLAGGEDSEDEADADGDAEREEYHPQLDLRGHRGYQQHQEITDPDREYYPDQPSQKCKCHCLGEELQDNGGACSSDRFSNADLLGPLSN